MTILEFANAVLDATGSKCKLTFKDLPVDDPKVRRPDISCAKEILGWEPKVGLEDGVVDTVRYFRGLY